MRSAHQEGYRMEDGVSPSRVSRWRRVQGLSCDYVIKDRTDLGGVSSVMIEVRPKGNAMQLGLLTKGASVVISTSGLVEGRCRVQHVWLMTEGASDETGRRTMQTNFTAGAKVHTGCTSS